MYRKLLLSNQGGIIDEIHRSTQDNCAVVAIGLGGTGVSCLKNLKAKVFNRVIPDDPDSAVPRYDHIRFLAVDSDKTGLVSNDEASSLIDQLNLDTEYMDISYQGNIIDMFKACKNHLNNDSIYKEWLEHDKIEATTAKTGACGVRQIGRYLFMQKAGEFVSKVQDLISEAKTGLIMPKVYVHIFSGIGGGTGAGTFLDACYLVQKAISSEGSNAFTCGYFFLPDVNISRVADKETRSYIQINGYASLQELDYCMNFQANKDKWCQRYPNIGLVENDKPPVDICHLISGKNAAGDIIPDAYNYAMNVVTDYFMDFMVKTDGFTMESHIANFVQKKSQLSKDCGARYEYCVLGASNAALPFKEVLTYLASKIFESFADVKKNQPLKSNIDEFIKTTGLSFNSLLNMLTAGADLSFPKPDCSPKDAHENDKLTTEYFADLRSVAINAVDKNFSVMTKNLESYDINHESGLKKPNAMASVITKIFNALYTCIIDPDKGPYYAAKILNSTTGYNLVAVVDGHIAEIDSKIGQLEINLPQREQKRMEDQNRFFSNRPKGGNYANYVESSRNLIIEYTKRQTFYKMKEFLIKLRKQIVELSTKYCNVYESVISELIDTFEANRVYLEDISDNVMTFEYPIATINELKGTLTERVKEIDIRAKMIDFQNYMLDASSAWIAQNENEISKLVSKYFINMFSEYTEKTMTSYLQDKYDTDNTAELVLKIRNDIMNTLDKKASPLYWTSAAYNSSNASKIGYVSVPDTSEEVCQAAENLHKASPELDVRKTALKDRITVMRCFVGAPIFGYHPIDNYEVASISDVHPGKHLYEGRNYIDDHGKTIRGKDWRNLPSLTPFSRMNSNNSEVMLKIASHAKDIYLEAEKLGFIAEVGTSEYVLRVFDEAFVAEIRDINNKAKEKNDAVIMFEASEKVKAMLESIVYSPKTYAIKNDGRNGEAPLTDNEMKTVRIDHFASAPIIVAVAEEQIRLYKELKEIAENLVPQIDTDFEDYTNALFTGAISVKGTQICYMDDFGMDIALSKPNMKMGAIRPYQAFVSYKELDKNTRDKLAKIAADRNDMAEVPEETLEACKNIKTMLDPKMKMMMLQVAKTKFPEIANDILQFFKDLENKLDEFMMTYGILL